MIRTEVGLKISDDRSNAMWSRLIRISGRWLTALACIGVAFGPATAEADAAQNYVRVACMPELNLFLLDFKSIVSAPLARGLRAKSDVLRKNGLYEPEGLDIS